MQNNKITNAESKLSRKPKSATPGFIKPIQNNLGIFISLVVICVILTFASEHFLTYRNIINVLQQISTNAIMSFGMTLVILLGGIDLSIGAVLALSGISSMALMGRMSVPLVPALILGVLIGTLVGAFNGLFITKLKMPPFIVTLSSMNITRGLSKVLTSGKPIYVQDERLMVIGNGKLADLIPYQVIYMLIIFVILFYMLNFTRYGKHIYATGGNSEAAVFSGVNTKRVILLAYIISGTIAGLAGIFTSARLYSGLPTMGEGAEMDAIASVVLGGTMMSGGSGTLGGTLIGALIIGVMNNGLNLLGVNSYWQEIAKGFIILLAIFIDIVKHEYRKKPVHKKQ